MTSGAERIAAERQRQKAKEHFTAEHDAEHIHGELALAACCYAAPERLFTRFEHAVGVAFTDPWPRGWEDGWDKRSSYGENRTGQPQEGSDRPPDPASYSKEERIDLLTKAGALCAAEIDRLLRLQ